MRVLDADPRNEEIQALIAILPADTPASADAMQIIAEDDFDLASTMAEPTAAGSAVGVPTDIEKEVPPLEAVDTQPTPPPLPSTELIEGFSLHGFDAAPERDTEVVAAHSPAEGLESTSFEPPEEKIAGVDDLDDSLDSGVPSFQAPTQVIQALDGLQGSGGIAQPPRFEDVDTEEFAAAERPVLDDGLVLPPQGDPIAEAAHLGYEPAPYVAAPAAEAELLDFDLDGDDAITESAAAQAVQEEAPAEEAAPAEVEEPMELSASVLAAETELMDAGETPAPVPLAEGEILPELEPYAEPEAAPTASAPFDTETMAELYVAQGLTEQALGVYARLLAANPSDVRLQGLVASLRPVKRERQSGPTVREFFARMASRRPGGRGPAAEPPAEDDFAGFASISEPLAAPLAEDVAAEAPYEESEPASIIEDFAPEPVAEPEEVPEPAPEPPPRSSSDVAPAIERAAAMRTPAGSIDALFNHRSPGTSEDSAASALAQAFGATAEAEPLIVGRPARAASAELSLDSVFRDGSARPPRTSQSFSFDQFFTAGATTGTADRPGSQTPSSSEVATPGEPPAERSADDIQQFNSWLQGLKPR
jgi:hypothetical protein